jgi:hypothetical protein
MVTTPTIWTNVAASQTCITEFDTRQSYPPHAMAINVPFATASCAAIMMRSHLP